MKKNYIAPQMVETEITLRSCICSGGGPSQAPVSHTEQNSFGGDAPKRISGMYI